MKKYPALIIGIALLVSACSDKTAEKAEQSRKPASAGPAKPVEVMEVEAFDIAISKALPGRIEAYSIAEIRPQVSGIIEKLFFQQGSFVEAGQPLYQIDPARYEADFEGAEANLQNAQADDTVAQSRLKRFESLITSDAISEQELDNAQADAAKAKALVALAEAELTAAEVNLKYTKMFAPISGYIGPSSVTQGALVTAQQQTALATIRQLDPIYVDLSQAAEDAQALQQALLNERASASSQANMSVTLLLGDEGRVYNHKGQVFATDLAVDENTSTIQIRTLFENPDGVLLPGMFVRATINQRSDKHQILVPQKAVSIEADGSKVVWVVNQDNEAVKRKIVTSTTYQHYWVVEKGLKQSERVVIEGTMMLKPGLKVSPKVAELAISSDL